MSNFLAGVIAGVLAALIYHVIYGKVFDRRDDSQATEADSARLNSPSTEEKERAKELEELKRQFNNMMAYTGKDQKKA